MLPIKAAQKQGGGGDPNAQGVFDKRHYVGWGDYGLIRERKDIFRQLWGNLRRISASYLKKEVGGIWR